MCFNGRSVFSFASFRFRLCHPFFPAFTLRLPSSPFLLPASASASYRPQSVRFVMPFLSFFYVTEFIWLFCLLSCLSVPFFIPSACAVSVRVWPPFAKSFLSPWWTSFESLPGGKWF